MVIDRHLPVLVLAPLVFPKLGSFSSFQCLLLLKCLLPLGGKLHYGNLTRRRQVSRYKLPARKLY
jgi:hypothetical protein